MAIIGSDKKDGVDAAARMLGSDAVGLGALRDFDPKAHDFKRSFFKVDLTPKLDAPTELLAQSNAYWEAASGYGLVDSVRRSGDGTTHLVLSLRDDAELEGLVAGDPGVKSGAVVLGTRAPI